MSEAKSFPDSSITLYNQQTHADRGTAWACWLFEGGEYYYSQYYYSITNKSRDRRDGSYWHRWDSE